MQWCLFKQTSKDSTHYQHKELFHISRIQWQELVHIIIKNPPPFFFFFNFMEWEVRLQALLCLAVDKTKRVPTWISHLCLIYRTRGTRDTNDQWVTRADRKLLVSLDNQEWRCFLKICTWCQVCKKCILESNAIVLEKWSPCPGDLVGFHLDLDLYCWNSCRSSWSII